MKLPLTAVIVNKNNFITLKQTLKTIIGVFDQIVVVDHNSDEIFSEELHSLLNNDDVVFYQEKEIIYSKARNKSLELSDNEYIIKWDTDFCALRECFGAKSDCYEDLKNFLEIMKSQNANYLVYSIPNIGPNFSLVKGRAGINGDVNIIKKNTFRFHTGRYADDWEPLVELKRVYFTKENTIDSILHLDLMKSSFDIVNRYNKFQYDIHVKSTNKDLSFEEYCQNINPRWNKENYIIDVIEKRFEGYLKSDEFDYLNHNNHYNAYLSILDFSTKYENGRLIFDKFNNN